MSIHPSDLSLYHHASCPYCQRVRAAMNSLGLDIELRDIREHPPYRDELVHEGGMGQVPCLRIHHPDGRVEWLYESADIIQFLEDNVNAA